MGECSKLNCNIPDFVESIGGVGDQLTEEDFLVAVEGVDDQAHELSDLGLESKGLHILSHCGVDVSRLCKDSNVDKARVFDFQMGRDDVREYR